MKLVDPITEQMIRTCLRYEPETGHLIWINHWSKPQMIGRLAASKTVKGYKRIKINGIALRQNRVVWFLHYGHWPEGLIDHIDGNKENNSLRNLRVTDVYGNARNKAPASSTGFKGVSCKANGRYSATITPGGEYKHLGTFVDVLDAAKAYDAAARHYFGEFARLNFPEEMKV